jgi:hypothetical protein
LHGYFPIMILKLRSSTVNIICYINEPMNHPVHLSI